MKAIYILLLILFTLPVYTNAQLTNPRHPAEWEEIEGVLMEFGPYRPHKLHYSWDEVFEPWVKTAQACIDEEIDFYLLYCDTNDQGLPAHLPDTVFANRGISSPLIHFIRIGRNTDNVPWARDNGPYQFYKDDIDTVYNIGFKYDSTAHLFSNYLGEKFIFKSMPGNCDFHPYYDGGNWLTDGHNTFNIANQPAPCGHPGGLNTPAVEPFNNLGIHSTLNVKGVDVHVDYWLKMLDEETLMASTIPESNYIDYDFYREYEADINSSLDTIKKYLLSVYGRPFKIIRTTNAPSFDSTLINLTYFTSVASYTNALIMNSTVLVPQYGVQPNDTNAIIAYRQAMPGYNIVGIGNRLNAPTGGAIHCLSREIYSRDPIYIKHIRIADTISNSLSYPLTAVIKNKKGITAAFVYWKRSTDVAWNKAQLQNTGSDNFTFDIPGQPDGTTIQYYLEASNAVKTMNKPFVAPGAFYSFVVSGSVAIAAINTTDNIKVLNNPAQDVINIVATSAACDETAWNLYDITGRKVKNGVLNNCNAAIPVSDMSRGTYVLQFINGYAAVVKKVVVQ